MLKSERGQSVIVLALLIMGVFAAIAIYMANSRQNFELSSTVGSSIASFVDEVAEGSAAEQAAWTEAHANRHNKHVLNISSKCNAQSVDDVINYMTSKGWVVQ